MKHKNLVSNNATADLQQSWHIPRPTLAQSFQAFNTLTPSNNSTQSAKSGSLLLTAVNLAQTHEKGKEINHRSSNLQHYLEQVNSKGYLSMEIGLKKNKDTDDVSVASSTHFTVVNMNTKPQIRTRGFCRKHQLSVLVISMSILFTLGVLAAIVSLEMRAQRQKL